VGELIVAIAALAVVAAVLALAWHRLHGVVSERADAAADYVSVFVSAVYLILLTFLVVVLWQRIDDINADVRAEAADLNQLIWTAHREAGPDRTTLRTVVRDYATAVLVHEWPADDTAGAAPATGALNAARAGIATPFPLDQQTTLRDDVLSALDDIGANRADRLAESHVGLPGWVLGSFVVLSVVALLVPFLLGPRLDAHGLVGLAVTIGGIAAAGLLVWELLHPYGGLVGIDPTPLRAVLANLGQVS
jgi:hypothetical protein